MGWGRGGGADGEEECFCGTQCRSKIHFQLHYWGRTCSNGKYIANGQGRRKALRRQSIGGARLWL